TNLQLKDFTIETWVQRASTFISSPNGGPGLLFSFGGGGYGFGINDDGTLVLSKIGVDAITSSGGVADTSWHYVAVTKSATNVVFFIDGNAGAMLGYTNQFQFSTPACIGAMGNNSGFPPASFYGAIDELSIYNRALRAAEIQAISQSNGGGKCQQLPRLAISRSVPTAIVTWPVWASGFNLQSSRGGPASPGSWTNLAAALQTNGLDLSAAFPITNGQQFFRLAYPQP
ncbi:MAG: hypothetical protein JWQ04_2888, partial [Pedosphaera sp.]|nr:hypothetical protein [Pedosphaera sp.]